MKKSSLFALAAVWAATTLPTAAVAAEASPFSFNVGAVTDYRYRGISQSHIEPAVQGGVDWAGSGFYAGAWASSIKWIKHADGGANAEVDVYGGYKGEIAKDFSYDVGVLTYQYPGHGLNPSPATTELYGALTFGPATLKYSHSVTNLFGFADSKGSGYIDLSATFEVGGVSITPHVGHQSVRNNTNASYTDYSLTVSKDFSGFLLSAAVVDTNTSAYPSAGKDLGKAGVVLGVKYSF